MIKELSIDNWILAGTGFLIIFTIGCFFYFQNVMAQLLPQNDDHSHDTQQLEKSPETPEIEVTDTIQQDDNDSHSYNIDVTSNVSTTPQKETQNINRQQTKRGMLQLRILM